MQDFGCESRIDCGECPERIGRVYDALMRSVLEYYSGDVCALEARLYEHAEDDCRELSEAVRLPLDDDLRPYVAPICDMLAKDELMSKSVVDVLNTWLSGKTVTDRPMEFVEVTYLRRDATLTVCAGRFVSRFEERIREALQALAKELVFCFNEGFFSDAYVRDLMVHHLPHSDVGELLSQSLADCGFGWVSDDLNVSRWYEAEMCRLELENELRREGELRQMCSDDSEPSLSELI